MKYHTGWLLYCKRYLHWTTQEWHIYKKPWHPVGFYQLEFWTASAIWIPLDYKDDPITQYKDDPPWVDLLFSGWQNRRRGGNEIRNITWVKKSKFFFGTRNWTHGLELSRQALPCPAISLAWKVNIHFNFPFSIMLGNSFSCIITSQGGKWAGNWCSTLPCKVDSER